MLKLCIVVSFVVHRIMVQACAANPAKCNCMHDTHASVAELAVDTSLRLSNYDSMSAVHTVHCA
jgi:hypothetical protein